MSRNEDAIHHRLLDLSPSAHALRALKASKRFKNALNMLLACFKNKVSLSDTGDVPARLHLLLCERLQQAAARLWRPCGQGLAQPLRLLLLHPGLPLIL